MSPRALAPRGTVAVFVVLGLAAMPAASQAQSAGQQGTTSRTAWGDPDLQGYWSNATPTPLERPGDVAGKEVLSDDELSEVAEDAFNRTNRDRRDGAAPTDVARAYNDFWNERGTPLRQTSLIVDPPDGRVPPLTPDAVQRAKARAAAVGRVEAPPGTPDGLRGGIDGRGGRGDNPEDRGPAERCIMWPTLGPPMMPTGYNSNYQIHQGPGYVVIEAEMIHDARVIPLDGRPHVPAGVRQWAGDSRGRWEGSTLVVETTNFSDKTSFRGAGPDLRVVERFTRVDADTLAYEFTVDDPKSFGRPWTARIPMRRLDSPIYEYACHEGNYGMANLLSGSRTLEKAAADAARKGSK